MGKGIIILIATFVLLHLAVTVGGLFSRPKSVMN